MTWSGSKAPGVTHQDPLLGADCGEWGIRVNGINVCRVVQGVGHLRQGIGRPAVSTCQKPS